MQCHRKLILFGSLFAIVCWLSGVRALAVTPYAITATNVTMPSSGYGTSQFTVSGIPGAGTVTIGCAYSGPVTVAKIPQFCGVVGAPGIPVPAGETTFSGNILFVPFGQVPPPGLAELRLTPHHSGHLPATALALAGALMLGFSFRRRARRWLAMIVFATVTLVGLAGISGCIEGNVMTPGTYQYTISAAWTASGPVILSQLATTNINVTVP
ncbi:MAG TPA: hypothetical protein VKF63_08855 [Terracidiphilus sp.]|nr:hypothetical protein [Terracidiphilus sp.]